MDSGGLVHPKDFWHGTNSFVTGAAGFLGSWICEELVERGANVIGLVRDQAHNSPLSLSNLEDRITLVRGDVRDLSLLERCFAEYDINFCFHLAAQATVQTAIRYPLSTLESNIKGTWILLEAIRRTNKEMKLVVASSDKAYGESTIVPYHEELPLQGIEPYSVSKSCADLITQSYAKTYGLNAAIARCGNIHGGRDLNFSRIVPGTIRSLSRGERPVIRSNGNLIRDYIYVEDVVRAYMLLAQHANSPDVRCRAFNFGTGNPVTVHEIVALIAKLMNQPDVKPIILNQAPFEIPSQYLSSERAKKVLDWTSAYSLEEGLKLTTAWYLGYLTTGRKEGFPKLHRSAAGDERA
jgi:CDP-glucose 4,6-dehydratase